MRLHTRGNHPLHRQWAERVDREGRRFVDESLTYNDFVRAGPNTWDGARYTYLHLPMYLIVDQQFRERYPLCGVPPSSPTADWMVTAETPQALAQELGIVPAGLEAQVAELNSAAQAGADNTFHQGEHGYGRYYSGPRHDPPIPHPSLGTLEKPPFYGLRLYVGTFGYKGGLLTNRHGQALDLDKRLCPGSTLPVTWRRASTRTSATSVAPWSVER